MIRIIPYLERNLHSKQSVREIANRLHRFSDSRYNPWWDTPERDAASGEPTLIRFQMIPVKKFHGKYDRTFEPVVTGRIEMGDAGSKIHLTMRLGGQNAFLYCLWIGFSLLALWRVMAQVLAEPDLSAAFPVAVLKIFGLSVPCLMHYHFRKEADALLAQIQKRI